MSQITLAEQATPATPSSGTAAIYPKSDGLWYSINDSGTEVPLSGISSGEVIASGSLPAANLQDITDIPQTYRALQLLVAGASSNTASRVLTLLVSYNNGSSFETTGYAGLRINGTPSFTASAAVLSAAPQTQTEAETDSFVATIQGYQSGAYVVCQTAGAQSVNGQYIVNSTHISTSAVNALRLIWNSTGNFDAGTYELRGIP